MGFSTEASPFDIFIQSLLQSCFPITLHLYILSSIPPLASHFTHSSSNHSVRTCMSSLSCHLFISPNCLKDLHLTSYIYLSSYIWCLFLNLQGHDRVLQTTANCSRREQLRNTLRIIIITSVPNNIDLCSGIINNIQVSDLTVFTGCHLTTQLPSKS